MKRFSLILSLGLVAAMSLLSGCSSVTVVRPQIDSIKKIAVVGMTANYEIYDVASPKSEQEGLMALGKMVGTALSRNGENLENTEIVQVTTYGLKSFGEAFAGINGWALVDPAQVIANSDYKNLQKFLGDGVLASGVKKLVESSWVTPPGMQAMPVNSVVLPQGMYIKSNQEQPEEKVRAKLAALCTSLGADGVAVVQLDLGYKKTWLSGMSGSGLLFGNVRGRAKPSVSAAIVIVDKTGTVVLRTDDIERGGGNRSVGSSVPMMLKGKADLADADGKSVHGFNTAIDDCSSDLKTKIAKKLAKT